MPERPNVFIVATHDFRHDRMMGSSARIRAFVAYLSQHANLTFVLFSGSPPRDAHDEGLVYVRPQAGKLRRKLARIVEKISGKLPISRLRRIDLEQTILGSGILRNLFRSGRCDLLICEYLWSSVPAMRLAKSCGIPVWIDVHDVLSARNREADRVGRKAGFQISRQEELGILRKPDLVIAIQRDEAEELSKELGKEKVLLVEHSEGDSLPLPVESIEQHTVLFVGSKSDHNLDALNHFIADHWESVRRTVPGARLLVCGSVCEGLDGATPKEAVEIQGRIDDLSEWYARAAVVLNIPRYGSGLKIKAIEAFRYGKALLCTPTGAQGLAHVGEAMVVSPWEELASRLIALLEDDDARLRLGSAAVDAYDQWYSPDAVYGPMIDRMNEALGLGRLDRHA